MPRPSRNATASHARMSVRRMAQGLALLAGPAGSVSSEAKRLRMGRKLLGVPTWLIAIGFNLMLGQTPAWAGDAQSIAPSATAIRVVSLPFDQESAELAPAPDSRDMAARWREIQHTAQPARLIFLSEEFERDFPASQFARQAADIAAHARAILDIQRSIGLSSEGFVDAAGDSDYRKNLLGAVSGDQDAAFRIAMAYRDGLSGLVASARRMEQWLRFSAELGSGKASWVLAENFNNNGFVADAARFEKRAQDLGYRPPIRLPSRGY